MWRHRSDSSDDQEAGTGEGSVRKLAAFSSLIWNRCMYFVSRNPFPFTDLHTVLAFAKEHLHTTTGKVWQEIILSLAFERKADLSLIQYFEEVDQARLFNILEAFMSRELSVENLRDYYLEFFPRPKRWEDYQDQDGPSL